MFSSTTHGLIFGRSEWGTKLWGLCAIGLFLGSLVYFAAVKGNAFSKIHDLLWVEGYAVLLLALIIVQAYSNGGLLLSWMLAFAGVAGVILNGGGIALTGSPPGLLRLLWLAILGGAISAATIGTLGFVLGTSLRRVQA